MRFAVLLAAALFQLAAHARARREDWTSGAK
jgi:hypothetical protein